MNQTNTKVVGAIFIALGVMLVVGLVVIPATIHGAQARSITALERNKGQRGFEQSGGQGGGGLCGPTCGE